MKVLLKDKITNTKEVRCDCNRHLFIIKGKEIFIKCKRCKRYHRVEIIK